MKQDISPEFLQQQVSHINLNAKLYHSHDTNSEFNHTGKLLSTSQFDKEENKPIKEILESQENPLGFLNTIIQDIKGFFLRRESNETDSISDLSKNFSKFDDDVSIQSHDIISTVSASQLIQNELFLNDNGHIQGHIFNDEENNTKSIDNKIIFIDHNVTETTTEINSKNTEEEKNNSNNGQDSNAGDTILPSLSPPIVSVQVGAGLEDHPVSINITLITDSAGQENSIIIGGLPPGATLNNGLNNGNGTWTLSPIDLQNLHMNPPEHSSGSITLTITASTSANGLHSSTQIMAPIFILGIATTPSLHVQTATGLEDTSIALTILANLTDTDGSEILSVSISGIPLGTTLNQGIDTGNGTWLLDPTQLTNLTLTPPADFSGNLNLLVTAISSENGTFAYTSTSLSILVSGIADAPSFLMQASVGIEDTNIPLHINAGLTDIDGSETLSITVSGLPPGATLSAGTHNPDGSYTLTPAQLNNLMLTPPPHFSGDLTLSVTATASENGTTATTSADLPVTVIGVATAPALTIQAAAGFEDSTIALNIAANLVDTDGSETLSITISGLPSGATLSAGTHNPDGSYTLTPAQLNNLNLIPAAGFSGSINLNVTAISFENGTTASTSVALPITIVGIADTPTLSVHAVSGNEGTPIPLDIYADLNDQDGSESLSIIISGVPAGTTLSAGTKTSAGINNGSDTWTLTALQLQNVAIITPPHWSGSFSLAVTATASEGGTSASSFGIVPVTVIGVATAPALTIQAAAGFEDSTITLNISANLVDTDGSETLSITVSGLPPGTTLSAGTHNPDGSYTLTPAQLNNLTLTPPPHFSGDLTLSVTGTASENGTTATTSADLPVTVIGVATAPALTIQAAAGFEDSTIALNIAANLVDTDGSETLSITISGLPSGATLSAGTHNPDGSYTLTPAQLNNLTLTPGVHWSGNTNLLITATSSENFTTASTSVALPITIVGIADTPTLSVHAVSGNEGTPIPLDIHADLNDQDGSESLSIIISGVPAGTTLSAGIDNGNGTWTLTPAQLQNISIITPPHWSGSFSLAVTATASEGGTSASSFGIVPVTVIGIASTPLLTVNAATGIEGSTIALDITASLTDTDGSETLSITVSGLPPGATLSAGTHNPDGSYTLMPAQLNNLTLTPNAYWSGNTNIFVTATSSENGSTSSTTSPLLLTITPNADAPTLILNASSGYEDTAISLNITAIPNDPSEIITISISGVPVGASLSAGINAGGGVWNLTAEQLENLKIIPSANSDADFSLNVTATSHESNNLVSSISGILSITVTAVADTPTISATDVTGSAGTQIPLNIVGNLTDIDGSENISFIIHGIPDGFTLNKGTNNGDNSWTLMQSELSNLKLISPENFNGQLNLYAQSVAHDHDGSVALSNPTPFYARIGDYASGYLVDLGVNLHVGGIGVGVQVGTLPPIDLFPASGGLIQTGGIYTKEDTTFQISDAPALLGLPVLSTVLALVATIQFQGIPVGTTFSAGTNKGGGVWEFTVDQLNNLTMTPPTNSDNDFTMTVVAKMLFGLADIPLVSTPVHIIGIADTPSLTAPALVTTNEGTPTALNISGALTDADGSETISYLVSGMPTGSTLNHGIDNGNGSWSLHTSDLSGLTITPSADYSGSTHLVISAISSEREGDQTVAQTNLTLNVTAIADAPIVLPISASGTEDHAVALNLGISLKDNDGSETISAVTISGLPAGATLLGATDNHNGTWSVNVNQIDQVQFVPGKNWNGDATLNITATSQESSNNSTAMTTSMMIVHIEPIADAPLITANDSIGNSGEAIDLHVNAILTDPNESLSAVISGVPNDAVLSAGLNNGDGTWNLRSDQLSNLQITPSTSTSGDLHLLLTVYSHEVNDTVASTAQSFDVHVILSDHQSSNNIMAGSWLDTADNGMSGNFVTQNLENETHTTYETGSDYQYSFQNHQTG